MAARWCRDHLGAFIATFGMILVLFGISALLTYAFLQLDYHFSRPLAGDVIPPEVTQAVAWGTRLFTLVAGSLAIYFHVNDMPKWRNGATTFGAIGAILLMLHAYGVAAKIMEGQYAATRAVERVAGADVSTVADQIADINAALTRAASDRDAALNVAQQTIDSVKDQVVGLSAADNQTIQKANADKAAALAAYDAKVIELEAQKQGLRTSQGAAISQEAKSTSIVQTFNPLFTFLARLTTLNFDPSVSPPDGHKYVWGAVFFTLFFGFGELALMFCLTGAFAALKVVSERKMKPHVQYSDDIPDGMTRWEGTAEEWDEIEAALAVHRNIKTGAKKGARTKRLGNKIEAESDYYRQRISMFMDEHNRGLSTSEIAAKHGMTVAVMRMSYGPYMSPEESAALFPALPPETEPDTTEPPVSETDAEPEPEAEADTDLEIPPEPKEWPVGPHDPNRKTNGAADQEDRP
jgi:hypothetical protein